VGSLQLGSAGTQTLTAKARSASDAFT
jgi:hypothetical protein